MTYSTDQIDVGYMGEKEERGATPDLVTASQMTGQPKDFGTESLSLLYDCIKKRWVFTCDYYSRHIPKDNGFWWDKETREWFTTDPFHAMKLIHYSDGATRDGLAKLWCSSATNFQASQLPSAEVQEVHTVTYIPVPHGMDYLDYQRVGIEFLVRDDPRCGNTLLGDEMGLGKTIEIIGAINYLSDAMSGRKLRNVLIVCPASLKINWGKELKKWLVGPLTWAIASPKYFPRGADIVVINYENLGKWESAIASREWDLLVADEAHYAKNPNAGRSKALYSIAAHKRIYATGTPIVNRPKELFPLVNSLDPSQFPKFMPFAIRYCNARKMGSTWDFTGASHLPELQARLRSTIMLRRLKKDVLTQLPPKTRKIVELPAPRTVSDLLKRELEAYNEREPMLEALRAAVKEARAASDTLAYQQAVDALKVASGQAMGDISTLRKEVALKKVPIIVSYLEDIWKDDPERKIGLWCHHHDVMDAFMNEFRSFTTKVDGEQKMPAYALKFSGKESLAERDQTVTKFQNDPRCLLFVGQIQAGGVGITLTAASHCIFAELDWVPGNLTQAEDRHHRLGQRDNVLVEHLVLEGSLDCRIAQRVVDKQKVIDAAMNDKTEHLNQHSMAGA